MFIEIFLFSFLVSLVLGISWLVYTGKKHSRKRTIPLTSNATRPQIVLSFDEEIATKLESDPLFQVVFKECQSYLNDIDVQTSGTHSAKVMGVMEIVERYSESNPAIAIGPWSGVIVHKLFPGRYSGVSE